MVLNLSYAMDILPLSFLNSEEGVECMNYQDGFCATFAEEKSFLQFLYDLEKRADWQTQHTNQLCVYSIEDRPDICDNILNDSEKEEIMKDTLQNTGMILRVGEEYYPLGTSALSTLESRARISGTALRDLEKADLAMTLSKCLLVTRGEALVRIHEGKARAVHGGDKGDYAVLPMPELFEVAAIHVAENYDKTRFSGGFFDHSLAMASWEIQDEALFETYRELMKQYEQTVNGQIAASIRVQSSDVGTSGANIFYSLLLGAERTPLILGKPLKLEHRSQACIESFCGNMAQIFARYKEAVEGLSTLFHVHVSYPANVMAGVMKKSGIGKALTARTVEQFKAGHGPGGCNGYELYCGICEVIFLAQSNGMNAKGLADLEEMVSRCLSYHYHEYDIPGVVAY